MKDRFDFTYAEDLRYFIGYLLDDYCPIQFNQFDSDILYDVIKDLKESKIELTSDRIFVDCCFECNALLNKDLTELKENFNNLCVDELSFDEQECVKVFLGEYHNDYDLIDFDCNGTASSVWLRNDLKDYEIDACRILDKHFDVFKKLEDRVDIQLSTIRKKEISREIIESEGSCDENKTVTLSEFLEYFDFEYKVIDRTTFQLEDITKANLGDIESETFELSKEGVRNLVERLDTYVYDYLFSDFNGLIPYCLKEYHHFEVNDDMTWKEMYDTYVSFDSDNRDAICECVFNPDLIEIDKEYIKEKNRESEREY